MQVIFGDRFDKFKKYDLEKDMGGVLPKVGDKIVWDCEPCVAVKSILYDYDKKIIFMAVE